VEAIVRGQWESLRRRYLAPMLTTMFVSAALMIAGDVTSGFGGMSTPAERGLWLFWWLANIMVLPLRLTALIWVAMRRALVAQQAGEAAGIAVDLVLGIPVAVLVVLYWTFVLAGVPLGWWWGAGLLSGAYVVTLMIMTGRARRIFLGGLRHAAGGLPFFPSSGWQRSWIDSFGAAVRSKKRSRQEPGVLA